MDPNGQLCFWGRVQLEHRKTRGCSASSSEQEGSASEHTRVENLREEWWKSSLWHGAIAKPKKSPRGCSLTKECRATAYKWLNRPQVRIPRSGLVIDFSNWTVWKWRERYGPGHPNIADLERCRLCAQASSATSESAFSKMGLIISKKRQQLTANHVDGIRLLG